MKTLLLDTAAWDLVLDAAGNMAAASDPYSMAQDAASAIRTFLGECWWDTTVGVPYGTILAERPSLPYIKQQLVDAAMTVPGVSSAQVFISDIKDRGLSGQVQVTSAATGVTSVASFSTVNPMGIG